MRRVVLSIAITALAACGQHQAAPPSTSSGTGLATAIAEANRVVVGLQHAGRPVLSPVPQPLDDAQEPDGLQARVNFRDARLLSGSDSSDTDTTFNGGTLEVFDNERDAVAASRDRGGYVLVNGRILLRLASDMPSEWVIEYRQAFDSIN